jgi:hypothetical protein
MKLHGVSRFSIFKNLPETGQKRQDAMDAMWFFEGLQNHLEIDDVLPGSDPPDFVIVAGRRRISAELTRLNPKLFGQGGFRAIEGFTQWVEDGKTDPARKREYGWGEYSLKEALDALKGQLENKAKRALDYANDYDESWLLFRVEEGGPAGGLVENKFVPKAGQKEAVLDFAAKYLFEMNKICRDQHPFNQVIMFTGPVLLAFPHSDSKHGFPTPNVAVLERGAKAGDEFFQWKINLKSLQWRWDESQGDFGEWWRRKPEDL